MSGSDSPCQCEQLQAETQVLQSITVNPTNPTLNLTLMSELYGDGGNKMETRIVE